VLLITSISPIGSCSYNACRHPAGQIDETHLTCTVVLLTVEHAADGRIVLHPQYKQKRMHWKLHSAVRSHMLVRACVYRNDPEAVNRGPPLHYLLLQRRGQPQSHGTMEGEAAAYGSVPAVRRRRRWCSRNSGARTAARQHPPVPAGAQREREGAIYSSRSKSFTTRTLPLSSTTPQSFAPPFSLTQMTI
jgi:hypothetical protein